MEEDFAKSKGIEFYAVPTGKLRRYFSLNNLVDFFKIPVGVIVSIFKILSWKPDIIFSKGGFVGIPIVIAGAFCNVPILIHESDYSAGLGTKIASFFARKVAVSNVDTIQSLPKFARASAVLTGIPIRKEVGNGSSEDAVDFLGRNGKVSKKLPYVLIMGGSTGALNLNRIIWSSLKDLLKFVNVIHIAGKGKMSSKVMGSSLKFNGYFEFEYLNNEIFDIYELVSVVVCRSGAGTVAEINAMGIPAIYVPLPAGSSRGDQFENATHMANKNSVLIEEEILTFDILVKKIKSMLGAKKGKKSLANDATNKICNLIIDMIKHGND